MKRVWTILCRDLTSTTRDALLLLILVAPIAIALGVRILLPGVGSEPLHLAMTPPTAEALGPVLSDYAAVIAVDDRAALERRVLAYDEAVGVVPDGAGGYGLLLEGNESESARELSAIVLRRAMAGDPPPVAPMVEVGTQQVPYREWVGVFIALSVLFFGAIAMGFYIIEDRESGVIHAIDVTPLRRSTYILARASMVAVLGVTLVYASLVALGVTGYDPLLVLLAALAGLLPAVLFGFVMGAVSDNQIAGFAFVKIGFWAVLLPAILALFLPDRLAWLLYWVPTYWVFRSFQALLVEGATWAGFWPLWLATLATGIIALAAATPWLRRRLARAHG